MRKTAAAVVLVLVAHPLAPTDRPPACGAAVPADPFYQRLARRGPEPRPGAVEPGTVGGRPVRYAAGFDAAGRRLVTSTRAEVHVWQVPGMEPAQRPLALPPPVGAADLSPDGTLLLTVGGDGQLHVWRVGADEPLWGRRHGDGFAWATFSPGGRAVLLIERGSTTVRVLDAASGRETLAFTDGTAEHGLAAAISRNGSRVVTSSLGPTRVWSAATGRPVATLPRFGAVFAISPGGDRVAGLSGAGEVSTFDAASGKLLATIGAEERGDSQVANIWALAFSPDGRLVAVSKDDLGVRVWDAATGRAASPRMPLPAGRDDVPVSSVLFTPDGRRVVLGNSYGASVWDVAAGTRLAAMDEAVHGWPAPVGVAVGPDGRHVAVNFGGPVELWERRR